MLLTFLPSQAVAEDLYLKHDIALAELQQLIEMKLADSDVPANEGVSSADSEKAGEE